MKFSELIEELKSLADKGLYTRGKIDWWLIKYEKPYQSWSRDFDLLKVEFPNSDIDGHKLLKKQSAFLKLYDSLYEVSENYRNEKLDKELVNINEIIDNIKY
ncbi:hypothetical protein PL373_03730 [Tenacibaculum maritimum]|nr:hypothetical protein [Tenacibaculum maritimum]MDB0600264.1 hypothetical protein [Tenacibaculum maritimum]MDB0610774.1 hypothetical protein [Tenacibaculum maritimum]